LTDEEFELVASAAAAQGSAVAAWVGSVAVRAASSEQAVPVPVAWREVLQQLVRLRLDLASPTTIVAVPEGLVQRIDLLIGKAGARVRRS
jgi:hypothetical protein